MTANLTPDAPSPAATEGEVDLAGLRELLAAATPGPWEVGDHWHIQGEKWCRCDAGPLVWSGVRDINGSRMKAHVHRRDEPIGGDIMQADASTGDPANVTFSSDYGPGVEDADAALITAAINALPALLDALDAARERVWVVEGERDRWEYVVTQVEGERDAAREALQRIYDDHQRQTETWNHRNFPTENASHWHDGFVTACAKHAIEAKRGLDPEGAANDDRVWKIGATGTDLDWYHETGHCGRCGDVATNCGCNGECGCFSEHGPRKEPYVSPTSRAESAEAARDALVAGVEALAGQMEAWDIEYHMGRTRPTNSVTTASVAARLRALLGGAS